MATTSISGGNHDVSVYGNGTVSAGSGNDRITIFGTGDVTVGSGADTISMQRGGNVVERGASGQDTINIGSGNAFIDVQGSATVYGSNLPGSAGYRHGSHDRWEIPLGGHAPFGSATIAGGVLQIQRVGGVIQETAVSGTMTLIGGNAATEFIGGSGSTVMRGISGHDTFIGGSGQDTMSGSGDHNVFDFLATAAGGHHVITNFVTGDQLNVDGQSLAYLVANHQVTSHDGNTYISVDGGKTTIELQGVVISDAHTPRHGMLPVGSGFSQTDPTHGVSGSMRDIADPKDKLP